MQKKRLVQAFTHPVVVFVFLQVVWIAVLFLWISANINHMAAIREISQRFGPVQIDTPSGVLFLIIGCLLLASILVGTVILFIVSLRQSSFLHQQRSFVSSVTHELRSPLASLRLATETLEECQLPKELFDKQISMMQLDIRRLETLVDRILISSRLDQGLFDPQKDSSRENLSALLHDIVSKASYLDQTAPSRTYIDCPNDCKITVPKSVLTLVFGNLVENAIKYSPADSPIHISATLTDQLLSITIADQGFGLSSQEQRKIFKMFFRADTAYKNAISGTGLGLYIVKTTVRLLGGNISVQSSGPMKGSTFKVELPAHLQTTHS